MKQRVTGRKIGIYLVAIVLSLGFLMSPRELEGQPAGWFEFPMPWDDGSPSFLSWPSSGPITQGIYPGDDGDLHLGSPTGPRIRLFGVAMTGATSYPSQAQAQKTAARLAKLGFNLVKFSNIDDLVIGTDPVTLDSTKLNALLNFISELKSQGIYVGINLPDGFCFEGVVFNRYQCLVDPTLIQRQKDVAQALLVDTGLINDPVLAYVQFDNEVSLFSGFQSCELDSGHVCESPAPLSPQHLTAEQSAYLDQRWNDQLLAAYTDRATLKAAWEQGCDTNQFIALEDTEDPAAGTVKRIEFKYQGDVGSWQIYCPKRLLDELTFYYQLEQEYVQGMVDFLRTQGFTGVITTIENFYGVADKMLQAQTGALAHHNPWAHPSFWNSFMTPPFKFVNWPMTKGPVPESILQKSNWPDWIEFRNVIWRAAVSSAVKGKPYLITEYNHPLPNEFQAEFPLLIAAYAAFQGWDGIVLHEYGNAYSVQAAAPGEVGSGWIEQGFELADNPAVMAQIPVAARIFRNGWVQEGSEAQAVDVPFWEDGQLHGPQGSPEGTLDDWWQCLQDYYCYWEKIKPSGGSFTAKGTVTQAVDPALVLERKVRMEFYAQKPSSLPSIPTVSPPYDSDTGELHWDMSAGTYGLVTIDAPRVNAAIGSIDTDPQLSVLKLSATGSTSFGAVSLVSLDGQPLTSSQQLLLTAVGRVANTGMDPPPPRALDEHTLNDWGGPPTVLEPIQAQVTLRLPNAFRVEVYRLDERGNLDTQVPVQQNGNDFVFSIGTHNTLWYGIVIEPKDPDPTAAVFAVKNDGIVVSDRRYFCGLAQNCFNAGAGADLAERIDVSEPVEPGDVVEIDPQNPKRYRKARGPYSPWVAGVIASSPGVTLANRPRERQGILMHIEAILLVSAVGVRPLLADLAKPSAPLDGLRTQGVAAFLERATAVLGQGKGISITRTIGSASVARLTEDPRRLVLERALSRLPGRPLLALMGRVYVKATTENGPISPGDLLTTASKPGYAMRCPSVEECAGTLLGKALEPLEEGEGFIEALVVR